MVCSCDCHRSRIADETNRLAGLIGDVLDTSRIEAGTFSYSFTDVDIGRLVEDAVAAASIGQDEVRVHAAVKGPVPRIRGDRERLRQVLTNLIDNAVKYAPGGDEVEVTVRPENGVVRITTKHGLAGRARWRIYSEGGVLNDENQYPTNYRSWGHLLPDTFPTTKRIVQCTLLNSVRAPGSPGSCRTAAPASRSRSPRVSPRTRHAAGTSTS